MLIDIPFNTPRKLFRYGATPQILKDLSGEPSTVNSLARKSGLSWGCVRSVLRALEKAEYVVKRGRMYVATDLVDKNSFTLNLRDTLADDIFAWKGTRQFLYQLYTKPGSPLTKLSEALGLPYRTVKAIAGLLEEVGLTQDGAIKPELIKRPVDPLRLVPRKAHREALQYFLSAIKVRCPDFNNPIVLFGEASWGKPCLQLDLATILEVAEPSMMHYIAEKLVQASEDLTLSFGITPNLNMMTRYTWIQLKLDVVSCNDLSLRSIVEGICVHGRLPCDEEFFELGQKLSPMPEQKLRELLGRGLVKEVGGGKYAFTEKAIKRLKVLKNKSKIAETSVQIGNKQIRIINTTLAIS